MNQLFIIATVYRGGTAEISTFRNNYKAVKHISEESDSEFSTKPHPDTPVEEYLGEYIEWIQDENDNMCETAITLEIVDL